MIRALTACCLLLPTAILAEDAAPTQLVLWDCEGAGGVDGLDTETANVKQGQGAVRWRDHPQTPAFSVPDVPADWTDYNLLRLVNKNLLATTVQDPPPQVVCRNVTSLNFRYLDGSSWADSWDSSQRENEIPPAVEVSLELRYREPREEGMTTMNNAAVVEQDESDRRFRLVVIIGLPASAPSSEEGNQFIR